MLEFSARHALQGESRGVDLAQDLGMPIRLHGIRPSLDRAHAQHRRNRRIQSLQVVNKGGGLTRRNIEQRAALLRLLPPIQSPRRIRVLLAKQLRPSRTDKLVRTDAREEPLMKLGYQPVAP